MLEYLEHNLTDFNQFVNWFNIYSSTPIAQATPGELREALSYWFKHPTYTKVKKAAKAIVSNSNYERP